MARSYSLNNLLERLLCDDDGELHIVADSPPFIITGRNAQTDVGSAGVSNADVANLLYNLATVDQMKELNACGEVQFIYLFRNWARFSIMAYNSHSAFSIKIKKLRR